MSWGAIFAGLFAVLSTSWLLYLLGGAIGVSVADAADSMLMDDGLPEAVIVWMLLSALIAYFVGGAAASRLAGTSDEMVGMLHGFTLWSVATTVMLFLSYWGMNSLLQTGQSFVAATASATASAAGAVGQAAGAVGQTVGSAATGAATAVGNAATSFADTDLASSLRDELSRRAARAVASADPEGGPEITASDIRASIRELDGDTLNEVVQDLINDDQDSAAELIASQTDLTPDQAAELIEAAYNELEEKFGNPDNNQSLATDLRRQMNSQVAGVLAQFRQKGFRGDVTRDEIEQALNELDTRTINRAASRLMQGDAEGAKDALANGTSLTEEQIEELVGGVTAAYENRIANASQMVEETVEDVEETVDEVVETTSSYAQAVLWSSFASTGLGLAMAVLGGWCGADTTRRLYYETRRV